MCEISFNKIFLNISSAILQELSAKPGMGAYVTQLSTQKMARTSTKPGVRRYPRQFAVQIIVTWFQVGGISKLMFRFFTIKDLPSKYGKLEFNISRLNQKYNPMHFDPFYDPFLGILYWASQV